MEELSNVLSGIGSFIGYFSTNPNDMAKVICDLFNNIQNDVKAVTVIVTQAQESTGVWDVMRNIYDTILPVGYSLLVLFFMIGFLNKTIMFEFTKMENIVKLLLKLILAKVVMESSFEILALIYSSVSGLIIQVSNTPLPQQIISQEELVRIFEGMNFIERLGFQFQISPIILIRQILQVLIQVICYGRMIELYAYTAISPIPIATLSSDEYESVGKKFIQQYIGICLQGLIMVISCMFYAGLANTILSGLGGENVGVAIWGVITMSIVLLLVITKSEDWAKRIIGA